MQATPSDSWADWIALAAALVSLVGLGAQHLWFRHEIAVARRLSSKGALVERPIEGALDALADLELMSKDLRLSRAGVSYDAIKSHGARTSRRISSAVNLISRFEPNKQDEYEQISSDDLVEHLEALSETSVASHTRLIEIEITRLRNQLERCLSDLTLS